MKRFTKRFSKRTVQAGLACLCAVTMLIGCGSQTSADARTEAVAISKEEGKAKKIEGATEILLSDAGITVDGATASENADDAVYVANDIVFYLEGQGFTYGEGTEEDEHAQEEADEHTVVHITKPGTYAVSGQLSAGQIAIDLGEDAEKDPEAVVTLIMNNADITCTVAPAVIFYNVYECGDSDTENASNTVDTTKAGANVLIADGTYNTINGSYVAKIYKSYELNESGTEVVDSKKLHKYDGAFYSKMSMNINGDEEGTGVLEINAENEGLDSELHLTINGGNIKITSGNDGINTNEDGVSVTTVNGGNLCIIVDGSTGEGDGVDSNGWLVINGGTVRSYACSFSGDAGIDSDMGIHINGGNVIATGNMLDRISDSTQNYAVFSFSNGQKGGSTVALKNDAQKTASQWNTVNDYSYMILAGDMIAEGTYSLWIDDKQFAGSAGGAEMGFGGMQGGAPDGMFDGQGFPEGEVPEGFERPEDGERPELPEGMEPGEMPAMPEGAEPRQLPEGMEPGEVPAMPEGAWPGQNAEGAQKDGFGGKNFGGGRGGKGQMNQAVGELSKEFVISAGGNYFNFVSEAE